MSVQPSQTPHIRTLSDLEVKVCGMRDETQLRGLLELEDPRPHVVGFIFYPKSARDVGEDLPEEVVRRLGQSRRTFGVFVNADHSKICEKVTRYGLHGVQLHGDESADAVASLGAQLPQTTLWKAFGVGDDFDFARLAAYVPHLDAFLFDTKTPAYGGSGRSFDWSLLTRYQHDLPFYLSGGLGITSLPALRDAVGRFPQLVGLDFNSKLERAPGDKDLMLIHALFEEIQR